MIKNKPYVELMYALKCFPEASDGGYFIGPLVLKLAIDFGMKPYTEALNAWIKSDLKKAKVYANPNDAVKAKSKIVFTWYGKAYEKQNDTFIIGLRSTIMMIEYNVLACELKRCKDELKLHNY